MGRQKKAEQVITDWDLESVIAEKLKLLGILREQKHKQKEEVSKRTREITANTLKQYEFDIKSVQKLFGKSPSQKVVLRYLIKSALYKSEGTYFHLCVGIRGGYPELFKSIKPAMLKKREREKLKHHAKLSGIDIRDSRPIVEARQEEITEEMMAKLYEHLNPKHIGAVKVIEYAWNRVSELNDMTIRLSSRRNFIELKFATPTRTRKICKENYLQAFVDLGKILCKANGSPSIRQSPFGEFNPFEDLKVDTLQKAFSTARDKAGLPSWITLRSLRHQGATDLRNNGMDDDGIAYLLGIQDVKHVQNLGKTNF